MSIVRQRADFRGALSSADSHVNLLGLAAGKSRILENVWAFCWSRGHAICKPLRFDPRERAKKDS